MSILTAPASTRVQLCGRLAVEIDGRQLESALPGRQGRLLFAYLVLHRQRPVRRDELIGLLWPEKPPASPENALNTLVSRLRKGLGEGVVEGRSELTLGLPADAWIDVEVAFDEIQRAERALERSDWRESSSAADTALSIAERGLLPELQASWAEQERGRIEELRFRALECLAACGLGIGGAQLSVTERAARTLIAASPYRETGYRYLMQALAERGRVAEALTVFDDVRRLLQQELGAPPGTGLRALHERLLSRQGFAPQSERDDPLSAGSSTVALLFTDLVEPVDAVAEHSAELRRSHARVVRHAVAAHGGHSLTDLDDGLIAVFKNVRSALGCAVQMQQAVERGNRRNTERQLSVRAALHCGDPLSPRDEYSSASVAVAQRLCERAGAGHIVASALVRSLAGPGHDFRQLASIDLAGVDERLPLFEVPWKPATQRPFALPAALSRGEHDAFVGRESALAWLLDLYGHASRGTRRIVLLRGDPGIGKTRLATELALRAHADGAVVLYGRCDEEPLLPHQPFVEALRHYVTACPLADLTGQIRPSSGELRPLVPELLERIPDLAMPLSGDPEGERYRLFEAASALLCEAAEARPMVLVLDDLHWADKPSLLLLRHLIRYSATVPLLVLGTYRETEIEPGHPLAETLADLSRENTLERLSLGSLDKPAVSRLVRSHAGHAAPELDRFVFQETDGNPFFVVQMLRHLAESSTVDSTAPRISELQPGTLGVPEGVKDVIGRRIARLGQGTHRVLAIGSVMGRNFDLAVLGYMSDLDENELVETLEHAVQAGVIEEVTGAVDRYTFSHALIRETLYGGLTATRRALLHRRAAASIEEAHVEDLEPYRAELAHHLTQSGSAGDLGKAIEYGSRAAERAVAQLAYEQAAAHYRQAVSLIDALELPKRQLQRCDLVIAQGEAERRAGDPAYRETLLEGARLAQELGDGERLARAALANNRGFFSATTGVDRERVAILEAALDADAAGDSPTRAALLAHLAVELVADPDWAQRHALSDEALAMARRVGDPRTLVQILTNRYTALWGPRTVAERLANSREAMELADRLEDPALAFHATHFASHAAMEAGELALAERLLHRAGERAERLGQPIIYWYIAIGRAKRSSICGLPDEAEGLARAALEVGRSSGQLDAFAWYVNQLVVIRYLQGTLGIGRPNLLKVAESGTPYDSGCRCSGGVAVIGRIPSWRRESCVCAGRGGRADRVGGRGAGA